MALFLGTYNVPTNKKLRVNNTDVESVYCNGTLVWQYIKPTTGTGTGTGTKPPAGAKGTWVAIPYSNANRYRVNLNPNRFGQGIPGWQIQIMVNGAMILNSGDLHSDPTGQGFAVGGVPYGMGAFNHSSGGNQQYYGIVEWIPHA